MCTVSCDINTCKNLRGKNRNPSLSIFCRPNWICKSEERWQIVKKKTLQKRDVGRGKGRRRERFKTNRHLFMYQLNVYMDNIWIYRIKIYCFIDFVFNITTVTFTTWGCAWKQEQYHYIVQLCYVYTINNSQSIHWQLIIDYFYQIMPER